MACFATALACGKQPTPAPQTPIESSPPAVAETPAEASTPENQPEAPAQDPDVTAAQSAALEAAEAAADAQRAAADVAAAAAAAAAKVKLPERQPKLAKHYVGVKGFGVNRVNRAKRTGSVSITTADDGQLILSGSLKNGDFHIEIQGNVHPVSRREFILDGTFSGAPNLSFRNEPPSVRTTTGRFLFRATGKRRYWRMYEVNGADCVCGEGCGNEFCYIDISFGRPTK